MLKNLQLYLIRHGQTNRNLNYDLIGQSPNEPLTQVGRSQAKVLGAHLKARRINFDHIYVSPYQRAMDTFWFADEKLNSEIEPIIDDRLREINQGDAINQSRKALITDEVLVQMEKLQGDFKFNNGESLNEVEARSVSWLNDMLLDSNINDGSVVAVFTHGMTIKTIIRHIMNIDHSFTWRIDIGNTSMSKFSLIDNRWFCNFINDESHLEK